MVFTLENDENEYSQALDVPTFPTSPFRPSKSRSFFPPNEYGVKDLTNRSCLFFFFRSVPDL